MTIQREKIFDKSISPEKLTFTPSGIIDETKAYNFSNSSGTWAGQINANKLTGTISDSVHGPRQAIPNAHHTKTIDAVEIISTTLPVGTKPIIPTRTMITMATNVTLIKGFIIYVIQ